MHDEERQHEATLTEHRFSLDEFSTPSTSWQLDDFVSEPRYVESREELRYWMLSTAQAAPPSPAHESSFTSGPESHESEGQSSVRHLVSHLPSQRRRIDYLKNYISEVAPWVSPLMTPSGLNVHVLIGGYLPSLTCLIALMLWATSTSPGIETSSSLMRNYGYICATNRAQRGVRRKPDSTE